VNATSVPVLKPSSWLSNIMISEDKAIAVARRRIWNDYGEFVLDAPRVWRLLADLRPDADASADAWEVCFPWKPVPGLYRSSLGCCVLVDAESGEVVERPEP
jgi:hypothetical protein